MHLPRGIWVAAWTLAGAAIGVAAALVSKSRPDDLLAFVPAAPPCMLLDLLWLLPHSQVGIGLPTFWPLLVACIVVYGGLGALLGEALTGSRRKQWRAAVAAVAAGLLTAALGCVVVVAIFSGGVDSDAAILLTLMTFLLILPSAAGVICYGRLIGRKESAPVPPGAQEPEEFDNPAGGA